MNAIHKVNLHLFKNKIPYNILRGKRFVIHIFKTREMKSCQTKWDIEIKNFDLF